MLFVSGNAQFSFTEVLHCSLAGVRRDRADSSTDRFLELRQGLWVPFIHKRLQVSPQEKSGWAQIRGVGWPGMWSVARDHARAKALLDELDGLMCGMRGGPILLEPQDGHEFPRTFAALPLRTS